MSATSYIKNALLFVFDLIGKKHVIECWRLKANEPQILPPIEKFYSTFIRPGMKVYDVGANVGNYSRVFLRLGASVVAIEPQKYCQQLLKYRFSGEKSFTLVPSALGAKVYQSEIRKSKSHTIASMSDEWINQVQDSHRFEKENWDTKEKIEVTTLDLVINKYFKPDYIKIDVEGFEVEVLKGLTQPVSYVSFEVTLPEFRTAAEGCVRELTRIGNYHFTIPESASITDSTAWKKPDEILKEIELLCNRKEPVSVDIFARLI